MTITLRYRLTGFLLLSLCLACAGCVHYSTPKERDASYSAYRDSKVGQESLRKYVIARSAALFMARDLQTAPVSADTMWISNSIGWYGTAAAIDQRGYFLTAAHCAKRGKFWLAFQRDGKLQIEPARVVWRGDVKRRDPDLAILCVSRPIRQAFDWATGFTNESPVIAVGLSLDDRSHALKTQCMAGRILKISEESNAESAGYEVVDHSSPLHHGDSGGPLVLPDGRLLGINVNETLDFHLSRLSFEPAHGGTHRPNLAWLRKVIDADAALQSVSRHTPSPQPLTDNLDFRR
jgi:S1-C subfamily serine protease